MRSASRPMIYSTLERRFMLQNLWVKRNSFFLIAYRAAFSTAGNGAGATVERTKRGIAAHNEFGHGR